MKRLASSIVAGIVLSSALSGVATAVSTAVSATLVPGTAVAINQTLFELSLSTTVRASALPNISTTLLTVGWLQVTPTTVAAIALSAPKGTGPFIFHVPATMSCARTCTTLTSQTYATPLEVSFLHQEDLLAELHYLPLTYAPSTSATSALDVSGSTLRWRFPALPHALRAQWQAGASSVILQGALMRFQSVHSLPVTGMIDIGTWQALVQAVQAKQENPGPYDYAYVTERLPETLTLYENNKIIFHTLVNTGIAVDPTASGTYPVYLRYTSQTMTGLNPDGTRYHDPGIPWISYFHGGDALHGFIRSTYGWPQSLGCVEMPFAAAQTVFPYTPIGTLVTVLPAP